MLRIKNLNKTFHNKKILNTISLDIQPKEIAIFLGESGVGKSTLLRILANLDIPESGAFELNGNTITPKELNKKNLVGMVFQNFNLFEHMTVLQNISFILEKVAKKSKKESKKIGLDLLKQYGLIEKKDSYPLSLSGGQKQRLSIARTLALNPQIICFDEPTSSLDPYLTNFIADIIKKIAQQNHIVLIATHDIALLDKLQATIYLIKNGNIIEKAKTEAFKNDQDKYPNIKNFILGHRPRLNKPRLNRPHPKSTAGE